MIKSEKDVKEWLVSLDMQQHHEKFVELGATKLHHLDNLDHNSDLTDMALKKLEMKHIKDALSKAETSEKATA